jgi:hypothetical protein
VFASVTIDRAGNPETAAATGDVLAPAPRARRHGRALVVSARVFASRRGRLTLRARDARGRPVALLAGSRIGRARAGSARRSLAVESERGKLRLQVHLRRSDGTRSGRLLLDAPGGRLVIPFSAEAARR